MAKILRLMALSIISGSLSGCLLMTRNDVREQENQRQVQDQVTTLQKTNADASSRFVDMESQLREMNGRVDRLENQAEQEDKNRDKRNKGRDELISEQGKTINLLKEEMVRLQQQLTGVSNQVNALQSQVDAQTKAESDTKHDSGKTPYDTAEELFAKKDWKKAILSYQKYRDSAPKSKKFPDATYKIGVCFQELGMNTEAKSFFEEVINKFPNHETAKKAKIRLKKVK